MKKLLLSVFVLFLFMTPAWAVEIVQTGTEHTVTYTEPTTNADTALSPLTDLARTYVTITQADGSLLEVASSPATVATGGGIIVDTIMIPVTGNEIKTVTVSVFAEDTSGNVSVATATQVSVDHLPPSPVK